MEKIAETVAEREASEFAAWLCELARKATTEFAAEREAAWLCQLARKVAAENLLSLCNCCEFRLSCEQREE